jgi:hypothetical protein
MKATKSIPDSINPPQIDEDFAKDERTTESVELSKTSKSKIEIEPGTYRYIDISDGKLTNCVLNTVICFRSSIVRAIVDNGQMTGLQLPEGNFLDLLLKTREQIFVTSETQSLNSATFLRRIYPSLTFLDQN